MGRGGFHARALSLGGNTGTRTTNSGAQLDGRSLGGPQARHHACPGSTHMCTCGSPLSLVLQIHAADWCLPPAHTQVPPTQHFPNRTHQHPRSGSRHRHPAQPPGSGHGPVLPNSGPLHPDTTAAIQAFLLASLGPPQGPSAGTPTCPLPAGSQSRSLRRPQRSLQMQTSSRNSLLQRSWWCQPNVWPRAGCLSLASSPQSAPRSPYANRNEPLRVL